MLIQILLLIFIIFVLSRTIFQFRRGVISGKELAFWFILWLAVGVVVILPQTASFLANLLGVGRGADLVIYLSILVLFYIVFRIFIRLDRLDREITKIVRELALQKKDKNK
jgi:hypothetical protein